MSSGTFLSSTDDICFYLQSGEWNRRTEVNINRLGDAAIKLINSQQIIESFLKKVQKSQDENIQKANKYVFHRITGKLSIGCE